MDSQVKDIDVTILWFCPHSRTTGFCSLNLSSSKVIDFHCFMIHYSFKIAPGDFSAMYDMFSVQKCII